MVDGGSGGFLRVTTDAYTRRPVSVFTAFIVLSFGLAALGARRMNIADDSSYTWLVSTSVQSMRQDAYQRAQEKLAFVSPEFSDDIDSVNRTVLSNSHNIIFMYDSPANEGGNIFTPANIQTMCLTERVVLQVESYPRFCWKACATSACPCMVQPRSAPAFFYSDSNQSEPPNNDRLLACELLGAAEVDAKIEVLKSMLASPQTAALASFFLSSSFRDNGVDPDGWVSDRTRSLLFLGEPLEDTVLQDEATRLELSGGANELSDRQRWNIYLDGFWKPCEAALLSNFGYEHTVLKSALRNTPVVDGLRIRYLAGAFMRLEFSRVVSTDLASAFISILIVFAYIRVHTRSWFVAGVTILQVLLSLPTAYFIYYYLLGIDYFSQMHTLAVFLVLGIGADDTFVFVDKWRSTNQLLPLSIRMAETLAHTAAAVFNTSFTTACAFASTAISPIMPIAAFGAFAASVPFLMLDQPELLSDFSLHVVVLRLAVIMNFCFCLTLTPVAVVIWETKLVRRNAGATSTVAPSAASSTTSRQRRMSASMTSAEAAEAAGGMAKFFHDKYSPFLENKTVSCAIVAFFVLLSGAFISQALKLDTPLEEEQWFPDDHISTGFNQAYASEFLAAETSRYVELQVVLGVESIDRSKFEKMKPDDNRGEVILDGNFDLSSPEQQHAFIKLCRVLRHKRCSDYSEGGVRIDGCDQGPLEDRFVYDSVESVTCFMEHLHCWYAAQTSEQASNSSAKCDPAILSAMVSETSDMAPSLPAIPATEFAVALQSFLRVPEGRSFANLVGFDDSFSKVQFAVIEVVTSLFERQAITVVKPVYETYERMLDFEARAAFPSAYAVCGRDFVWMVTQIELVKGVLQGFAICFPVSFGVLCLATGNIIVSLFATLSIGSIVAAVLGACYLMGWALGTVRDAPDFNLLSTRVTRKLLFAFAQAESIAAIIVIGFSVDYTVHLGHYYHESTGTSRHDKVKDSLVFMGPTVVAGGVTTFGAGAVMFLCQMVFFYKMAVLICLTITLSIAYSCVFFMAVLSLVGPEGTSCDIRAVVLRTGTPVSEK